MRRKKKKSNLFTILILSNTDKPVIRLKLPKVSIYIMFLFVFIAIVILFYVFNINNQLQQENVLLSNNLNIQTNKIDELQEKIKTMEDTTTKAQIKINELEEIESQMKEYMMELSDNMDPRGGISIPIPEIEFENTQEEPINSDLLSIKLIERYKQAIAEMERTNNKLKQLPTAWPASTNTITSRFGIRKDPFTNVSSFHTGIDLAGPTGNPVYAGADGKVILAEYYGGYGKTIIIRHSNTYKTLYGHLSEIKVKQGDSVKKGEIIGLIGNTGRSSGPHLHYEVFKNGKPIDPYPYMNFLKHNEEKL
ncbi:peptidoglycan DD-metalloendopeptidase family protein [Tepidibacillus infernus]|uniref:peptidoglycan DD-metalloendopeptidase family protein n=1 Tax=Tepidibacillus infernus TaxID=1806172 RepID=UPI003B737CCD